MAGFIRVDISTGGPKNLIPGMLVFSALGAGSQAVFNYTERSEQTSEAKTGFLHSKWSPVTPLSDQEYAKVLEEQVLKIDTEIALIDDSIASLRGIKTPSRRNDDGGPEEPKCH